MTRTAIQPTGREVFFGDEEIIVSKTDLKGHITYANEVFVRISGYSERELIGAPHSLIRHPLMPRAVFKLMWDTIQRGQEIFAYVINQCKNGDHYWVLAHVTPSLDIQGRITGYHSNRRCPDRGAVQTVMPLYSEVLAAEQRRGGHEGLADGTKLLGDKLAALNVSYDEFAWSLNNGQGAAA